VSDGIGDLRTVLVGLVSRSDAMMCGEVETEDTAARAVAALERRTESEIKQAIRARS
jgi:hypothetical protein